MEDWIYSVLNSENSQPIVLAAVFLLGIVSVFSCACNLAVIGSITGYSTSIGSSGVSKRVFYISVFFLAGILFSMSALGLLVGYTGFSITGMLGNYWKPIVGVILIMMGLFIMDLLPFKVLSFNYQGNKSGGYKMQAVLMGFIIGVVTSLGNLCCNPLFSIVLAASFLKANVLWGFLMLFCYALGYGLTLSGLMLSVGLGAGKLAKTLQKVAVFVKYAGGVLVVLIGFYFLITF